LAITVVFTVSWAPLQFLILLNQFYEHRTEADHVGDLLVVRLASFNQLLDPWVYILCKKVNRSERSNASSFSAYLLFLILILSIFFPLFRPEVNGGFPGSLYQMLVATQKPFL